MLDLFNIAKPQGCDIQIFYGNDANSTPKRTWTKPRGVSNVYMLLIGPGGSGNSTTGGGSGAVTVWYGSAQNVPDNLYIQTETATWFSAIYCRGSSGNIELLRASGGGTAGGSAMTANQFCAMGFFQSVAGQNGISTSTQSASGTTFLSGGSAAIVNGNYGYENSSGSGPGFFQLQPIIVGVAGAASSRGSIGCGGGSAGTGGPGMVLIASW